MAAAINTEQFWVLGLSAGPSLPSGRPHERVDVHLARLRCTVSLNRSARSVCIASINGSSRPRRAPPAPVAFHLRHDVEVLVADPRGIADDLKRLQLKGERDERPQRMFVAVRPPPGWPADVRRQCARLCWA
jgi:hypothetical protein